MVLIVKNVTSLAYTVFYKHVLMPLQKKNYFVTNYLKLSMLESTKLVQLLSFVTEPNCPQL